MHFLLVAILALVFITAASASPSPETNARRLSRGLPPLPPKLRRVLPGLVAREPTPVFAAKRAGSSPVPQATYRIEVRSSDGTVLGFVENLVTGISGVTNSPPDELQVNALGTSTGPYDIVAVNPKSPAPSYVGARGSNLGGPGIIEFATVQQTGPNAVPSSKGESNIWSIDYLTKKLTAQYVNSDGSKPPTTIGYDSAKNLLFFISDINLYGSQATTVYLYLVSA